VITLFGKINHLMSFLGKIFGKQREIHDKKHQIWVKWFTTELPKQNSALVQFPNLISLLQTLSEKQISRTNINEDRDCSDEEYFIQIFQLDSPIPPEFDRLTQILGNTSSFKQKIDKIYTIFAPYIFQSLILFMHQFPSLFSKSLNNDSLSQADLLTLTSLFHIALQIPNQFHDDLFFLLRPFFCILNDSLKSDTVNECIFCKHYFSEILSTTLSFIMSNHEISSDKLTVYEYTVNYFVYWNQQYMKDAFDYQQLLDITRIILTYINLDLSILSSTIDKVLIPIISSSLNLLSFIFLNTNPKNELSDIFKLGINVLRLLKHVSDVSISLEQYIWNHPMIHFLVAFTAWTLDKYPIISWVPTTQFDPNELELLSIKFKQSLPAITIPVFEFVSDATFSSPIVLSAQSYAVHDENQATQFCFSGVHEIIASKRPVLKLAETLASLVSYSHSSSFLQSYISASLEMSKQLCEKQLYQSQLSSPPELLATSLTFFTVQFLMLCNKNTVSDSLQMFGGYQALIKSYAFNPQHNLWSLKTDAQDLGFFCLLRTSIFQLFGLLFLEVPQHSSSVLSSIRSLLIESSPQMVDEAIKFLTTLFRSNPNYFVDAMSKTLLESALVQYHITTQSMALKIIDDPKFKHFMPNLGQSRILAFHFLDIFLRIDTARYYLYSRANFVSLLFHLLFEPMTQNYAIDLLKRGLCLDAGSFTDDPSSNPFDLIFPIFQSLANVSIEHINSFEWKSLMTRVYETMRDVLSINRKSLLLYVDDHKFMESASDIVKCINNEIERIEFANIVLMSFIPLTQANPQMRKQLAQEPMKNIMISLQGTKFGSTTIELLLQLVFETPIGFPRLNKSAEIRNQKILLHIHEMSKHLPEHSSVFEYVAHVCLLSVTNKLKIYQSKLPIAILRFITAFPCAGSITPQEWCSINALVKVFSTVSSFVFKWKTFFEGIKAMRAIDKEHRAWWVTLLVSTFTNILSSISHEAPSSFIYFDGRHSGIELPTIPISLFLKGWSFMIRFELSSVYGLPNTKPRLLSLSNSSEQQFELLFYDRHLICEYQSAKKSKKLSYTVDFIFHSNQWYHLVVTFLNKTATIYVDGSLVQSFEIKSMKFESDIEKGRVGNAAFSHISTSEAPLIFNMGCVYLFSSCLSSAIVSVLSKLPMDFVYGFDPSGMYLFPDLPAQIFDQQLDNSLIACYNARMTVDTTCANVARNFIGNALVHGQIIPFSTSFCDVTLNVGGLKSFLPLFEQVDLMVAHENKSDSTPFLMSLIGLFSRFCGSNDAIQTNFIQSDGMKCIAYLLSCINPATFQRRVILQLIELYNELKTNEHNSRMVEDLWLNFVLWRKQTPDVQVFVTKQYEEKIFRKKEHLLLEYSSVWKFVMLLIGEPDLSIRQALWSFIKYFASLRFTEADQDAVFGFTFACISSKIEIEALENLYFLMSNKIHGFHKIIEKRDYFDPFITLFNSPNENVRIFGIRFLNLIRDFEVDGSIELSSDQYIRAYLSSIHSFNHQNSTTKLWELCSECFFKNNNYQTGMYPFICAISQFYDNDTIRIFTQELCLQVNQSKNELIDSISQSRLWYMWTFTLLLQISLPCLDLSTNEEFVSFYSIILVHLIFTNKRLQFLETVSFFQILEFKNKWDTMIMFRKSIIKFLQILNPIANESIASYVFCEIFSYLFYIPSVERFSNNVSLFSMHSILCPNSLSDSIPGRICFTDLLSLFIPDASVTFNVVFSSRSENNEFMELFWHDLEVAKQLLVLSKALTNLGEVHIRFFNKKQRISELVSWLAGFIIRNDYSYIPEAISIVSLFLVTVAPFDNTLATFVHFALCLYRTCVYYPIMIPQSNQFFIKYRPYITKSISASDPLYDIGFLAKFFELTKEISSSIHQLFYEKSTLISDNIKQTYENIVQSSSYVLSQLFFNSLKSSFTEGFTHKLNEFNQYNKRQKILCEKAYKRIFRDLSSNGGPWCTSQKNIHWKLSNRLDRNYRHVFMKPNLEFDIHMRASLLRDEPTAASAQAKYERWLNTQDISPTPEETLKFDQEISEKTYSFSTDAQLITISGSYDGTFFMNNSDIYFDGSQSKSVGFALNTLEMVLHRSYLHIDSGLEFFLVSRRSYFVYFNKGDRDRVLRFLKSCSPPQLRILQMGSPKDIVDQFLNEWMKGAISNYEYLININFLSGRSFNDLSQYPVFPWVLSDYSSKEIDLNNPLVYRDFSKPVGAFNENRLHKLLDNYLACPDGIPEKCLYRFHYSNPFYVVHYLVRVEPFTSIHIELQDQKFDKPNRLFWSVEKSWEGVNSNSPDFRELIPEFFTLPDFLSNENEFDLGVNADTGDKISDVVLPPWCKSATEFIHINREALESDYVTCHINDWIDLIFGYKQSGIQAINSYNTFHHYCYPDSVTKEVLEDSELLRQIQMHASNTGMIPKQLFVIPHPKRSSLISIPRFSFTQKRYELFPIISISNSILYMAVNMTSIYIVNSASEIVSIALPSKSKQQQIISVPTIIGQIQRFLMIPDKSSVTESKSFAFFPEINRLIASSLWDSSFHVFKLDGGSVTHSFSQRQKFALISSLSYAGKSYLLTSWRDSSLTLWDIQKSNKIPVYRVSPHLTSLVDVDSDVVLDLIVSCDKGKNVILSSLSSGRFIRSFVAGGEESLSRVLIFDQGYILLATELQSSGGYLSVLKLYNLNTRLLSTYTSSSPIVSWCRIDINPGSSLVAVAYSSGKVVLITLPNMKELFSIRATSKIISMSYSPITYSLICADTEGRIFLIDFE